MPGKKKIKAKKTIPSPKRLNLPDNRPVKVNMSFEEGVRLAVNTPSPHKNMRLKDNNDPNLSSHPGFVEVLRASIDALPAVEKEIRK
jgi:hypothetical protein